MNALTTLIEDHLKPYRAPGRSRQTLRAKVRELGYLVAVAGDVDPADLTPYDVARLHEQRSLSLSPQSLNTARSHVATFFGWLEAMHDGAPSAARLMAGWDRQQGWRKDPTWLAPETFGPLLDAARSPRDRAFLALGLYTLLRGSDIASLRVGDVDLSTRTLTAVVSKVRHVSTRPIPNELMAEMRAWLSVYAAQVPLTPDMYLVPAQAPGTGNRVAGYTPGPLRPQAAISDPERIVHRALEGLGLPLAGMGCHTLRRSGATALYARLVAEGHADALRVVGLLLGHASVRTTEAYLDPAVTRDRLDALLAGGMFPTAKSTELPTPNRRLRAL